LRVMDEEAVERLFAAQPRLLLKLLPRTCQYLLASEARLIADLRKTNLELEQNLDYLRRTKEEVDYQELLAHTDGLTGLYNRRCFDSQLRKFIGRSRATGVGMALILVDLDDFKAVNDALGHSTGDTVLRQVGEIITGSVRSSDLPCRFGGDEFAIVLTGIEATKARERAEDVRRRVAAMPSVKPGSEIAGSEIRVTASLGGTMFRPGEPPSALFDRADRQLYLAKTQGRNRVEWEEGGRIFPAVASSAEK
ncbi:MAG: GGDEF domain-containing protein, partial [bacterium]|nr:GGDEF domain-containing protein [bacterium]